MLNPDSLEPKRATHYGTNYKGGDPSSSAPSQSHVGAIVGGTVGGVVALVLVLLGWLFWRQRRARKQRKDIDGESGEDWEEFKLSGMTPFVMEEAMPNRSSSPELFADSSRDLKGWTRDVSQRRHETTSDASAASVPASSSTRGLPTERNGQMLAPRIQAEIDELRRNVQQMMMPPRYDAPPEY